MNDDKNSPADKIVGSTDGLAAVHCPNCPDQGWYAIETGGCDMDGENDTREYQQEQCQFCYETPNSVFNIEAANARVNRHTGGIAP